MVELTVAVVSACIAAGIALFQFVLPNALALILTGLLSDEQPAVTWSVVSRFFLSSDWPMFLSSEAATSTGVPTKISLVTWTKPIMLAAIAVAAIVTPLGLYDEVSPARQPENVRFVYVPDNGIIGAGTPARSNRGYHFSRSCSGYLCPGDIDKGNVTIQEIANRTTNATKPYSYYIISESISPSLIDFYQAGSVAKSPSLSNYFDIQARKWSLWTSPLVENNRSQLAASYKYLLSILRDNRIELVEGLIIDTKNGGIGFRNHSVPSLYTTYGVEWEEDILWMQPETACVDTNITASIISSPSLVALQTADLVDRGGFANIQRVSPYYTASNLSQNYVFADANPDAFLYERAYFLAWGNNNIAMLYLNLTAPYTNRSRISSTVGQRFNVNSSITDVSLGLSSSSSNFFKLLRGRYMISYPSEFMWNRTTGRYDADPNPLVLNPYNFTDSEIVDHQLYCKGTVTDTPVNISRLDIGIGMIAGPAVLVHKDDPSVAASVETWERPFYACASATKMSIKTVRFRYNSSKDWTLSNLEVMQIKDKLYADESEKPIWGFETPWLNATRTWNLSMINPLWGLVQPSAISNPNTSTLRSEHFYIPASYDTTRFGGLDYGWGATSYAGYTPGTSGPPQIWTSVYGDKFDDPYMGSDPQLAAFLHDMTKNATSTAKLLNLMWTDLAGNALVGTRGVHQARYKPLQSQQNVQRRDDDDFSSLPEGQYPVYIRDRRIHYKWIYGIPAFICASIILGILVLAIIAMVGGRGTIARLRWYMFNTSSGRLMAAFIYPESGSDRSTTTEEWLRRVGHKAVIVSDNSTELERLRPKRKDKGPSLYVQVDQKEDFESLYSTIDQIGTAR